MEIKELYHELIIDHGTKPRNYRVLENPHYKAEGFNPLCGDNLKLYLRLDNQRIIEASFEGKGCAISMASASLMTSSLKGKTVTEAYALFEEFIALLTANCPGKAQDRPCNLGKLTALSSVREFPARVKCATLAWHTLKGALKQEITMVSTENV